MIAIHTHTYKLQIIGNNIHTVLSVYMIQVKKSQNIPNIIIHIHMIYAYHMYMHYGNTCAYTYLVPNIYSALQ